MPIPTDAEQRKRLMALKDRKGFGVLYILSCQGDVVFAASPVPRLTGYEIVSATSDGGYDIWKDGQLKRTNQSLEATQDWIHRSTPEWLYDDSDVTEEQNALLASWIIRFNKRYPGVVTLGK